MDKKPKKPHQHLSSLLCRQESRCSKPQHLSSTHLMYGVGLTTVISCPLGHRYRTTACRQPPPESHKVLGKPRPFNLPLMHIQTWSPFLNLQENQSDPLQISASSPPTQLGLPMAAKMVTMSFARSFAHMLPLLLPPASTVSESALWSQFSFCSRLLLQQQALVSGSQAKDAH